MKKSIIKVIAFALVAVMMCAVLVSCGGPSGEYTGKIYTLKFSGSEVTVSWKGLLDTYTMTGEFEMGKDDEGNKTISFTWPEGESYADDIIYGGAKAFFGKNLKYIEGSDDNGKYIEISGARFDAKK
jgi:hypothetical protein